MIDAQLSLKNETKQRTLVKVTEQVVCGGKELFIVGGPCSVENLNQMQEVASKLSHAPVQALRGGVFKPRTSPYAFQGLGEEGLTILETVRKASGLPVITEVMSVEQIGTASLSADVLQIGSRNMQNFELLKALGKVTKPILLKRGLSATIEEFVLAAEYVLSHGNPNVILCERGIRSFDKYTRNVLDLAAVVALRQITHLPVIVDPSHAAGRRELIADLSRAAIACGADGLIIECHPQPDASVSDAQQAISLEDMVDIVASLRPIALAVGRRVKDASSEAAKQSYSSNLESSSVNCRPRQAGESLAMTGRSVASGR